MKFYSEVTDKMYDSVEALQAAEKKLADEKARKEAAEAKKKVERENRAKDVEAALEVAVKAQNEAIEKLQAFIEDYGAFHTSVKNAGNVLGDNPLSVLFNLLNY